ncbi:co-chaperone YbbN [filamentous cyanobacterium CCP5]|nr:co-chaperone YbbN [filamentous cyanobacterium CCP5]
MGKAIDVTSPKFAEEVLELSYHQPVLVDFYAQWCGPCQMLKPLLEGLVQEYDFTLAKVDIDHNPELASAYQVEGVPDVRVVRDGQVQPGFVGVVPEPQLRSLLADLGLQSQVELAIEGLEAVAVSGNLEQLRSQLAELQSRFPASIEFLLKAAQICVANDQVDLAEDCLQPIDPYDRSYGEKAAALRGLIALKRDAQAAPADAYGLACQAAASADYEAALDKFLLAVEQGQQREAARKAMITVFKLLGDDHPLSLSYRRRLMQALY